MSMASVGHIAVGLVVIVWTSNLQASESNSSGDISATWRNRGGGGVGRTNGCVPQADALGGQMPLVTV
jgi:hypothetical protein